MVWIRTVSVDEDQEFRDAVQAQRDLYPAEYEDPVHPVRGSDDLVSEIVASHSLIPSALLHAFSTFGALTSAELPLSRRQQEMITTVVSATNRCKY